MREAPSAMHHNHPSDGARLCEWGDFSFDYRDNYRAGMKRVREALDLLRYSNGRRLLWLTARRRLYSRVVSIGVRRDLSEHVEGVIGRDLAVVPPAKIALEVRQLQPDDDLSFIADVPGLSSRAAQVRMDQRWLMSGDLPTPWVAVDPDGAVCFMTFMLTADDNGAILAKWGGLLPQLQPDEVLIEGPFAEESARGLGIMKEVAGRLLQIAHDSGARYVMGFIGEQNVATLKVVELGGLAPFVKREERWFLFRRSIRFVPYENSTK
jgi:hypothetical protein